MQLNFIVDSYGRMELCLSEIPPLVSHLSISVKVFRVNERGIMVECRGTGVPVYSYWEANLSQRHFLHHKSHVDGEKLVTNS
jgi:hypothetical protein